MKVSVDTVKCMGHGQCNLLAPRVYSLDERGYCNVPDAMPVPADEEKAARKGAEGCPEQAIIVIEDVG